MRKLDWSKLTFGKYSIGEVLSVVKDKEWQALRVSLKGKPLEERYDMLVAYLEKLNYSLLAKIRVTNYVNALRRGGVCLCLQCPRLCDLCEHKPAFSCSKIRGTRRIVVYCHKRKEV